MAIQSKSAPIGPWGKATAGATGAVLANALVYPLDMYVPQPAPPPPSLLMTTFYKSSPNAFLLQSQD